MRVNIFLGRKFSHQIHVGFIENSLFLPPCIWVYVIFRNTQGSDRNLMEVEYYFKIEGPLSYRVSHRFR